MVGKKRAARRRGDEDDQTEQSKPDRWLNGGPVARENTVSPATTAAMIANGRETGLMTPLSSPFESNEYLAIC